MSEIYVYNEKTVTAQPGINKFTYQELTVSPRPNINKFIESEVIVSARLDIKDFTYNEITVNPSPTKRQTITSDAHITHSHLMSIFSDAKIKVLGKTGTINSDAVISLLYSHNIDSDAIIFRQPKQTINSDAQIFHPFANILSDAAILRTYIHDILSNARILVHHKLKFFTNLTTKYRMNLSTPTNLTTAKNRQSNISDTNLTLKSTANTLVGTDFRTRIGVYDDVQPKSLSGIVVKKDGTELPDVDYKTVKIQGNLNRTPSAATFTIGRHHDDLDHDLDGNPSTITARNLIQIYDGDVLLFTGYITQIKAISSNDTVQITAEDRRCTLREESATVAWGCRLNPITVVIGAPHYSYNEKTVDGALEEIGFPGLGSTYCPQWIEETNDIASLLDSFVCNSGNNNWFIDANGNYGVQKVEQGAIKTLSLSSLNARRHLYDVILNDITLNKASSDYCASLRGELGNAHITSYMNWDALSRFYDVTYDQERSAYDFSDAQRKSTDDMNWLKYNHRTVQDLEFFIIQNMKYVGAAPVFDANNVVWGNFTGDDIVSVNYKLQYLAAEYERFNGYITVGSGTPQKDISLTEYGSRIANWKYISQSDGLYITIDDTWDYTNYAYDVARFTLSQNNKLLTEATVTLTLDAFEYYGIDFDSLINLNNTLASDCYNNANGFPLNVSSYSIDCATRTVTLNLTNYGKTYYQRQGIYLKHYIPGTTVKLYDLYKAQGA